MDGGYPGEAGHRGSSPLFPDLAWPQGHWGSCWAHPGPTEINPALGVSLCSNKCSGDSDDPSPASGQALISGPVAEGPIPGRCLLRSRVGASSTSSLLFTSSLHNRRGWEALEEKRQLFLFLLYSLGTREGHAQETGGATVEANSPGNLPLNGLELQLWTPSS